MLVKDAAREAAEQTLREHWNGVFPVDPVGIAAKLGFNVRIGNLVDDLSGAIVVEGDSKNIFVSDSDPFERKTFTTAHELGHYMERVGADDDAYSFKDARLPGSYNLHEFYADEFAGNLMMPQRDFVRCYRLDMRVPDLAAYFGVSRAAVNKRITRLRKDGIIDS